MPAPSPSPAKTRDAGRPLALACARAAHEIKAEDIRVLDLRGLSNLADFLVLCTGNSLPHLKAVLREIEKNIADHTGATPFRAEGKPATQWVVLDYIDVIVHVMTGDARARYDLESLWGDAPRLPWEEEHSNK